MPKVKDSSKQQQLVVKEIPIPGEFKHPNPKYDVLPKHEFTIGIIAPKGSGKTTLMCNLLGFYKKYFHTIIIFSPTLLSDDKWEWVRQQDLLVENVALKQWLRKRAEQREFKDRIVQPAPFSTESFEGLVHGRNLASGKERKDDKFDPKIPEDCFHTEVLFFIVNHFASF